MSYRDDVEKLGYAVTVASEGYEGETSGTQTGEDGEGNPIFTKGEKIMMPTIYRVVGHGVNTQLSEDDEESWKRLANKDAHASRELQASEDGTDPIKALEADLKAQVSLGDIKKSEADKVLQAAQAGGTDETE